MRTAVDVIIVSYNSGATLRSCVERLAGLPGVSIVVVDSHSSDDCLESIADLKVTRVSLTENRGFAFGANRGWQDGSAPYVLILNPDTEIDEESLAALVSRLDDDGSLGLAAPRIVGTDGHTDYSLRRFPRLRSTYAQALFLHRLFPAASWADELVREDSAYANPWQPEWVSGACMLVRREALERVEGLDEGFFLYCEDTDLCRRLRDHGYGIAYEPAATCAHIGGASGDRTQLLAVLAESRVRYARKHHARPAAELERAGIALGALAHVLVSRGGIARRVGHLRAVAAALRAQPV